MTVKVFYYVGSGWNFYPDPASDDNMPVSPAGITTWLNSLRAALLIFFFFSKRINCHMTKAAGSVGSPPTLQSARVLFLQAGSLQTQLADPSAPPWKYVGGVWLDPNGLGLDPSLVLGRRQTGRAFIWTERKSVCGQHRTSGKQKPSRRL